MAVEGVYTQLCLIRDPDFRFYLDQVGPAITVLFNRKNRNFRQAYALEFLKPFRSGYISYRHSFLLTINGLPCSV